MKPAIEHRDYFKEKFSSLKSDSVYYTFENIFFASRSYRIIKEGDDYFPLFDAGNEEILLPISTDPGFSVSFMRKYNIKKLFVAEEFSANFQDAQFQLHESPELHNYIYESADLAQMAGGAYESQRRQINHFTKTYDYSVEAISPDNIDSLYGILNKWEHDYLEKHPSFTTDYYYQFPALFHFFDLGLEGIVVRIDGKAAAFAYTFSINKNTFSGYALKTDHFFKGMYEFMIREQNRNHAETRYFNYCEDSGVEGLAEAKRRLKPVKILKMFTAQI